MADINSQLPVKLTDGTLTATVRDAGSNDALNVAIVDASGNQITSFGGGTQYAEDAASAGGESLTLAGAVRADTPASSTSADGDYANLKTDSVGRLWVNASGAAVPVTDNAGSLTVDNAGTFAVQVDGAALTSLQLIDDAVKTDDAAFSPATDKVLMIGAEFDDTGTDSVDEGDAGAVRMSGNRNLYTQIRDISAERSAAVTAANALKVDGSAVTQPVSIVPAVVANDVHNYDTTASVAASGTDNHDYTIGNTTLMLKSIHFAASGKMKVELQAGPVAGLTTRGVWFTSTANPSMNVVFGQPIEVNSASTGTIRLIRTNLESSSMDVYSCINGAEI